MLFNRSLGQLFSHSHLRRAGALLGAAAAACMVALAPAATPDDQAGVNMLPVTVVSGGLLALSDVALSSGDVLPPGSALITGDVVVEGLVVNVAPVDKLVIIEGSIQVLEPGDLLLTQRAGWQCFCTCGGTLVPTGYNSPDCDGWALSYLVGRNCPGGGTWQVPCQQVFVGDP